MAGASRLDPGPGRISVEFGTSSSLFFFSLLDTAEGPASCGPKGGDEHLE